jgi:N-acyl-D-amino-acid deacylase
MGLRNRGTLAAGNAADVVVLDVASLRDNASYTNPLVPPSGVQQVMVNGEFVLKDTRFTGRLPGVLLRKPQPRV